MGLKTWRRDKQTELAIIGLEFHDACEFFELLDYVAKDQAEELNADFFVTTCMKLRGHATNSILQRLTSHVMWQTCLLSKYASPQMAVSQSDAGLPAKFQAHAQTPVKLEL